MRPIICLSFIHTSILGGGGTSNKKVQGCSCKTFEHDPKIWMAEKFGPKNMGLNFNLFTRSLPKPIFTFGKPLK